MSEALIQQDGMHLQISLLACQAIESGDPIGFLRNQLSYHNVSEYHIQESGPLRFLMLLSDSRVTHAMEIKSQQQGEPRPKLEHTVYVAIANRVGAGTTGFPQVSLANFYVGQSLCELELAEGATAQALVLQCLSSLPMQSLFNLLGQGYKVVIGGRQFGGMVAHSLAAKLLLQVQAEIQIAQKMGINLSALSRTKDKVVSFAFSSPLFSNDMLQQALVTHNLNSNLHTIWKPKDASSAFLTLCCDFFSASSEQSSSSSSGPVCHTTLLPHIASPQFRAVQQWAGAVQEELQKLPRHGCQNFSAERLNINDLQIMAASSGSEEASGSSTQGGARSTPTFENRITAALQKAKVEASVISKLSSPLTGPKLAHVSPAKPPGMRPSCSGLPSPTSPVASRVAAAAATARPATSTAAMRTAPAGRAAAAPTTQAPAQPPSASTTSSWKDQLRELLLLVKGMDKNSPRLQPVGQFWLLEDSGGPASPTKSAAAAAAAAKAGNAKGAAAAAAAAAKVGNAKAPGGKEEPEAASVTLKPLPPQQAATTSQGWLVESNKEMFGRWEYSLEELKRDMIEVYAWTTFKSMVEVDGQLVDRKDTMRPMRNGIC